MRRLFLVLVGALALLVPAVGQAAGAPAIAFDPSPYDYGTIDANTTASQTFTLTNSGTKATSMLRVSLTGSSAFSITANTCTATSLGPNKSCTVTVQYAPTTVESFDSGTLSAMSKKPAASASASLSGASKSAAQALCESYLGTFTDPPGPNSVFRCDGWPASSFEDLSAKEDALAALCVTEFGGTGWSTFIGDEIASAESSYPTVDTFSIVQTWVEPTGLIVCRSATRPSQSPGALAGLPSSPGEGSPLLRDE